MEKYRKKAVVVDAMQFTLKSKDRVYNSVMGNKTVTWDEQNQPALDIATAKGDQRLYIGYWVVKDEYGSYQVYSPSEFDSLFESVNA